MHVLGDVVVATVFAVGQEGDVRELGAVAQLLVVLVQVLEFELDEFAAGDVVGAVGDNDEDCSDSMWSFVCLVDSTAQLS